MGSNFDRVAATYIILERAIYGSALQKARLHFLSELPAKGHILLLGDGDGRFLEQALRKLPQAHFTTVDASKKMLGLAAHRARSVRGGRERVTLIHSDAEAFLATTSPATFDAVCAHFFFDCFKQSDLEHLIKRIKIALTPRAKLLVSDFSIPVAPPIGKLASRGLITVMYAFFRFTSGLETRQLPDHDTALKNAGWIKPHDYAQLGGLLKSEVYAINS